jgi:putative redox protein
MTSQTDDPDAVTVSETGGGRFQVEVMAPGASFLADEPVSAGGLGSGPNPYDLLAAALGACTSMTLRLYAERKGWPVERVTVRVLHARTGLDRRDRFAREIALKGPLDADQRARLLEIANRCPVHRTLEVGSEIITVLSTAMPPALALAGEGHLHDMLEACAE